MVKRITLLFVVLIFVLSISACGEKKDEKKSTEEATQLHTMISRKSDSDDEWCKIYAEVSLKDKDKNDILTSSDIDSFTLKGNTDNNSYISIKIKDEALDMLKYMYKTQKGETLSLYIAHKKLCDIKFTEDILKGSIDIGKDIPYTTLCQWSSALRGL